MAGLEYRILGSLEALRDGESLPLGGAKQRATLAVLLLHANRVVATDLLVEALWPERPPGKPLTAIQGYVSGLRKALAPERSFEVIVTEPAGYRLAVDPEALDLSRFETLYHQGRDALHAGHPDRAHADFAEALSLFRGPPLAEFTYEDWAHLEIGRLEELRLTCVEERIEADLALGHHAELVGELEALIAAHPLRERLRGQLMLALYRSGRQSEALAAFQEARRALVDEFGIEPTPALQELERAILRQDPSLERTPAGSDGVGEAAASPGRSILAIPGDDDADALVALAESLARSIVPHELIVARLIDSGAGSAASTLATVSDALHELRAGLVERDVPVRVAAFTSRAIGEDMVRLASEQAVDLLLLARSGDRLAADGLDDTLVSVLAEAPCDVAVCVLREAEPVGDDGAVLVPFGGGTHDWAALELGAWIASTRGARLRLLGLVDDPVAGGRDASRLLAAASLAVQQLVGVASEPVLLPPGAEGLLDASREAALLVMPFRADWREHGLGAVRVEVAQSSEVSTIFVRRGVRPGGLAPPEGQTRFTWSLSDANRGS